MMLKGLSQAELEEAIRLATSRTTRVASRKRAAVADSLDLVLSAIAHQRTRRIIDMVRTRPQTAREIASALRLQRGVVSRYLANLREAGITQETPSPRDARERIISVKPDAFLSLDAWTGKNTSPAPASDTACP